MIELDPERLGKDSASSAYRRRRCAGSSNLIKAFRTYGSITDPEPNPNPDANPDAVSGTIVHLAWCGRYSGTLTPMQTETLRTLERLEKLVVTDWAGHDEYTLLGREVRLWLHQDLEPIHSGQFDVAYGTLSTQRMLIIDGKTLFGEVSPAEENDQMRELVGLARFNYPKAESFTVAILQPWVTHRPSIAHYDATEAELALRLLRLSIADAADPDAPRTPGVWCKHCPANSQCEEAKALVGTTYRLAKRIESGQFALPIGPEGARVLDSIETAETTLRALKASYKALITQEPDSVPGWYMREGNKVREIEDIKGAYEIAKMYMPLEDFLATTKVTIGALISALGQATHQSGQTLENAFNNEFSTVISFKQNAPVLARESARKGRHKEITNEHKPES